MGREFVKGGKKKYKKLAEEKGSATGRGQQKVYNRPSSFSSKTSLWARGRGEDDNDHHHHHQGDNEHDEGVGKDKTMIVGRLWQSVGRFFQILKNRNWNSEPKNRLLRFFDKNRSESKKRRSRPIRKLKDHQFS
jgi:hypothetical protein